MATTETKTTYIGAAGRAQGGRAAPHRAGTRYVDNMTLPGMLWMAVVRSPYAHARITQRRPLDRRSRPTGVVAAFSGADLADDWAGSLPCAWPVTERHAASSAPPARHRQGALCGRRRRGRRRREPRARQGRGRARRGRLRAAPGGDRRRGGARRRRAARPRRVRRRTSATPGRSQAGEVDRLFAEAAVTVKERYRQQRLIPNAIEPRGVLVQPCPATGEFTMWSATQIPHIARVTLSGSYSGSRRRSCASIAPDVGGGFGSKLNVYAEEALCLALARRLGRPVKWIEERSEAYLATIHGRDVLQEIELAATAEGKITAVRVAADGRHGRVPAARHAGHPAARRLALRGLLRRRRATTSSAPASSRTRRRPTRTAAPAGRRRRTRSSGRSTRSRASSDMDPVELRRQNFITEFPADDRVRARRSTPATTTRSLDKALELARLRRRSARSRPSGASAATRSSSASASRPTSRCAASRRRASSARSATAPAAGTRPRSAACRPGPCRC